MQNHLVIIFSLFLGFINIFNAFSSGILWWKQRAIVFRDLFIFWCCGISMFVTEGVASSHGELTKALALYFIVFGNSSLIFLFSSILGIRTSNRRFISASIVLGIVGSCATFVLYEYFGLRGFYLYLLPLAIVACHNWFLCGLALRHFFLKRGQFTTMGWSFLITVAIFGLQILASAFYFTDPNLEIFGPGISAAFAYAISVFGFASAVEISEKEKTNAKIQILEAEKNAAEKLNQTKSLFLANMSHELRTPMHGILSYARFGQQKIDSPKEKLKSFFDEIFDSGNRLMSLLNDLLDLAKLEAGKMEMRPDHRDLYLIAQATAEEMMAYATEKGVTLEVVPASPSTETTFDEERMRQVFRNLISNAVKFTKGKNVVRIEVEVVGEIARGHVTNWGIGIPEKELESIFDKFVQSSKTSTGAGGTGLGLAICREIIQRHDGRIWAENKSQGETIFSFEFPHRSMNNGQTNAA